MTWNVIYMPEAIEDMRKLDGSQRILVRKAINKVKKNPLPASEGGYGRPLGNKHGNDLTGLLKVKLKGAGIRIVYKLLRIDNTMLVVVIGAREDDEVYMIAGSRIIK